ncbi:hypothetical protein GpartN1_g3465.t1 [Galdieria partita]|uniref:Pre-rRNA-processing protein Ipi1 N-terminal domain-containing protein n=1 Tax=Galdieria partita TaxID=83374 RepID=A0A9C7PWV9_9RHOD|nr:hypothetical protein GpartN1_g3465.t1 [Galdieria partita]
MGKRKRKLRALETKHKSAALTNTEINRKRINVRVPETSNDSDSVKADESVSSWLSQLRKKNSVVWKSALRGFTKELKNIPVYTLEQHGSSILNAVIPCIIDSDEETRRAAVKLLGNFLATSSKPEFLPSSFMSHLKIHLRHNGVSAFETGSQLISLLKEHRKTYLKSNLYELLSLYTSLLDDNMPFSVESSEQQFCLAIQLMESFETLLWTFCEYGENKKEFENMLKNNGESESILVVVSDVEDAACSWVSFDSVKLKEILSTELVKLVSFICRTIRSFGKYPVVAIGDRPKQKKLFVVFSRLVFLIVEVVSRLELSKSSFEQCKDYLPILVDTLKSFRLGERLYDRFWEESFLRFAEFSCFLCHFLDISMSSDSNYVNIIITDCVDICNEYLSVSSQEHGIRHSQCYLVILANLLRHLIKQLSLNDVVPLVDGFLVHWIEADIHSQCDSSCLYLLWEVVLNHDLLCRCERAEKLFRTFLKVSWNALRSQYMENCRRMFYFWLTAISCLPKQYNWVYEESCYLVKNFFGKRKKENGKYLFVPGPIVFLDLEMKRVLLSLLYHTGRFCLEIAEVLLVCVEHPNCIADQSSWMIFGYFLELLKRFADSLSVEDRYYIACLIVIVVCRLSVNYPELETAVIRHGHKCLEECHLDGSSFESMRQIVESEKNLSANLIGKVLAKDSHFATL